MTPESVLHHRRSVRLRSHDYASPATYLVTICTHERSSLFGTMVDGQMQLNEVGIVVRRCSQATPDHFPDASLDAWTVMPDHLHGIIRVVVGATHASPLHRFPAVSLGVHRDADHLRGIVTIVRGRDHGKR